MLRLMEKSQLPGSVVPEMTSSMIEISTGICHSAAEVLGQLSAHPRCAGQKRRQAQYCRGGRRHRTRFSSGTSSAFTTRPAFTSCLRCTAISTKQFTIFGQHIHIGCPDADAALLMLHRMSRYIPHFIALSASSPYVQGQDTAFDSARLKLGVCLSPVGPRTLRADVERI